LYPASWRARYGAEFAALLCDVQLGWRDVFDILRGAILMHLKLPSSGKIVAALAATGLVVAAVVGFRMPDRFVSTAVMGFSTGDRILDRLNQAQQSVLSRNSLSQIVIREDLYKQERAALPLEEIIQNMRNRAIRIRKVTPVNDPQNIGVTFTVTFEYPDRYKAQAVTHDLTAALAEQIKSTSGSPLTLLDPPSLPQGPSSPNRAAIIGVGFAAGMVLGLIVLGIRRRRNVVERASS
jgi:hypothetical protein